MRSRALLVSTDVSMYEPQRLLWRHRITHLWLWSQRRCLRTTSTSSSPWPTPWSLCTRWVPFVPKYSEPSSFSSVQKKWMKQWWSSDETVLNHLIWYINLCLPLESSKTVHLLDPVSMKLIIIVKTVQCWPIEREVSVRKNTAHKQASSIGAFGWHLVRLKCD